MATIPDWQSQIPNVPFQPLVDNWSVDEAFVELGETSVQGAGNRRMRDFSVMDSQLESVKIMVGDESKLITFLTWVRDTLGRGTAYFTMPVPFLDGYALRRCQFVGGGAAIKRYPHGWVNGKQQWCVEFQRRVEANIEGGSVDPTPELIAGIWSSITGGGVLSNGNRTYTTVAVGIHDSVRTTVGYSFGRKFIQVTPTIFTATVYYAIAEIGFPLTNAGPPGDVEGWSVRSDGLSFINTSGVGGFAFAGFVAGAGASGTPLQMFFDFDNKKVWYRNGISGAYDSGGNPATGSGGLSFAGVDGQMFFSCTADNPTVFTIDEVASPVSSFALWEG